jgi:regulatory protein
MGYAASAPRTAESPALIAGRITDLQPDPRRPASVRVLVDGQLFCTVGADSCRGLTVGQPLDEQVVERLAHAADAEAAVRMVLRSLERRAYARADLGRKLTRRGHPAEAVEYALEHAGRLGLMDDAAFARSYVQMRARRGRGPARVVRDLLIMGVARALIDVAVAAEWPPEADRSTVPLELAAKRAAQLVDLPRPVRRRRILAYLARRGFTGPEAVDAVAKAIGH